MDPNLPFLPAEADSALCCAAIAAFVLAVPGSAPGAPAPPRGLPVLAFAGSGARGPELDSRVSPGGGLAEPRTRPGVVKASGSFREREQMFPIFRNLIYGLVWWWIGAV